MSLLQPLLEIVENVSTRVPLEIFTFFGALLEEIIAPIPSPLIMTLAGSIADSQGMPIMYLIVLALIGAFGKTIGALVIYVLSDKAEDIIVNKFGRFLGVSKHEIENIGKHFDGDKKEFFFIVLLRFVPVVPTAPISIISGILKINLKRYLLATFLGLAFRNIIYLYLGYVGHGSLSHGFNSLESIVQVVMAGVLGAAVIYFYSKRKKSNFIEVIKSRLYKK